MHTLSLGTLQYDTANTYVATSSNQFFRTAIIANQIRCFARWTRYCVILVWTLKNGGFNATVTLRHKEYYQEKRIILKLVLSGKEFVHNTLPRTNKIPNCLRYCVHFPQALFINRTSSSSRGSISGSPQRVSRTWKDTALGGRNSW